MKYIELDGKRPTHKFKNGVGAKTWGEVENCNDVALIVPDGYCVLDFDIAEHARIMLKIIDALDVKTRVMKTSRGIHCWFKADEGMKNGIKNRLAIGLFCDRKVGGRNAYVKIKQDGKMREWLRKDCELEELEHVPRWLATVNAPSGKFNFAEMGEGSGRNQELFNYIVFLQTKGFERKEVIRILSIVNDFVFNEPLPSEELETICRKEAFKPDDEIQVRDDDGKKFSFKHNEFGDALIDEFNLIEFNNRLYIYDGGYYQADDKIIERKMIEVYPGIKQRDRNEVLAYLKIQTHISRKDLKTNPYILNLNNTRLDIRTGECLPFTPDAIEFDRVPVNYDQSAYCADLDKMLNRVFCGDTEVISLFDEMVGYCLMKHCKFTKMFLLYGSGSNGKSTILDLLKQFLGYENISALSLDKITDKFATVELENKLANIGDDVNNIALKDTGTLKKISAGNTITVERKGEQAFKFDPYATLIFSANEVPRSFDKTDGFYRRFVLIPFNAKFTSDDEDFDPMISEKITTDAALSYLLNRAIKGAQRLIRRNGFSEPACVTAALNEYKIENSTVLTWITDTELNEDYFLEKPRDVLYSEFTDWCKVSGIRQTMVTGKKTFNKEIADNFGFDPMPRQGANSKRYFRAKI